MRLFFTLLIVSVFASLSAQVTDNFSDGDFTNNPTWSGDGTEWEVLNGELHLNNTAPASSNNSYLSTPSIALNDATWEFRVRLDFNPSSTNFVEVFLASDIADLEGNTNGYFVKLGGTTDEVSLFESSSGSDTEIIDGLDDRLDVSNSTVYVRVTRDVAGNWELFSDTSGTGSNLFSEGMVTDITHTNSSFFGIHSRYIASRATWCYLDTVNVSFVPTQDTIPPVISSVAASTPNEVLVDFNEDIDIATATSTANYLLNGTTNPTTAAIDVNDSSLVRLGFPGPGFPLCIAQSLEVSNVEDRAANAMVTDTRPFTYAVAAVANFKSVIINEIFADQTPQIGLPAQEFVELYNRGNSVVDLNGWTISDGGTPVTITTSSYLLCPGEYVVLADSASFWMSYGPVIEMNLPGLNNGGDPLGLQDNIANLIDSVEYDLSWYGGSPWDGGGYSLELINPTDTCALGGSNWTHSGHPDGGTPATANSVINTNPDLTAPGLVNISVIAADSLEVCFNESLDPGSASMLTNYDVDNGLGNPSSATVVGSDLTCVILGFPVNIDTGVIYTLTINGVADCKGNAGSNLSGQFTIPGPSAFRSLIINEIFADPDVNETNMPDGEFFELYNRSGAPIDLAGWTFSDASSAITLPSFVLQPGGFITVCDTGSTLAYSAFGPVLGVNTLPSLNNSGDELGLRDPLNNLVDTVEYDISWYQDAAKEDGGWSLELINPDDTCSLIGNWIASNDIDGGTPGAQNSVFNNTPDTQSPALAGITILDSNTIQVCFNETMDAALLAQVSNYSIDNGVGNPIQAVPQGPFFDCVVLGLSSNIDTGVIYTLDFPLIADCKGNTADPAFGTYVQGGSASPYQVVINEIMADPSPTVGLPEVEFIEIYNTGSTVVDITGWMLDDPSSTNAVFPSYNLLPGAYLIICDDSDIDSLSSFGDVLGTPSFPTLNISGDSLWLLDAIGGIMDNVNYDDSWYQDEAKEDGGWTLERIDPTFPCDNSGNWRASNDAAGGTPGQENSVLGTFVDSDAPRALQAQLQTISMVRVTFNENMDAATLLDPQDYLIDQGIGNPIMVAAVSGNPNAVDLLVSGAFQENIVYCVTIQNVQDCAGNIIDTDNTVCFGIPLAAEQGDVVINEILFNPYTGGSDFVELYNLSDKIIDLSTIYIGEIFEGTDSIFNEDQVSTSQLLLLPESYICLTADRQIQIDSYIPIDPDAIFEMSSFPSYDDSEGECVIRTDSGVVLDRFYYEDDYQFPNLDDKNGVSLERHDFNRPTQDEDNWHSAASTVRYATPGYENSQILVPEPQDLEVWLEPETFSPDQDGFEDVLSINYLFQTSGWNARITVFDNKGRLVRQLQQNTLLGTETGTFTWDGTNDSGNKVPVGVYVILVEASNPNTGDTQNFKLGVVVAARIGG